MALNDASINRKKKRNFVPIHVANPNHNTESKRKNFSANFNAIGKKKSEEAYAEVVLEIPENNERFSKSKKKQLVKENAQLVEENKGLVAKFNELEELSIRKISKLKDRLAEFKEIQRESDHIKNEYGNLLMKYNELEEQCVVNQERCENLEKKEKQLNVENHALQVENKQLNNDLNMMKVVVFRLNVHLERYQETLRKHNLSITLSALEADMNSVCTKVTEKISSKAILDESHHRKHRHTPISWGSVNTHTLGPLLDAYEDAIKEKDDIIQDYEVEFSNFTQELKQIMEENESLYVKLNNDSGCSSKLKIELESLRTELNGVKKENDVLIKKCAVKQDKLEEVLRVYESKVGQMKRDFDVLHEEYTKYRAENASLKQRNNALQEAQEDIKTQMQNYVPLAVYNTSISECKKWYEELKIKYESEKDKLTQNVAEQIKLNEDLRNEIREQQDVKKNLENKINILEKNIKRIEAKYLELEHTLSEVQLSRSALRKQLHKAMSFAKDMVTEQETLLKALNQRHLENQVVKKLGTDMAVKMDNLKSQLKDVQKNAWQEFSTVEKTVQEQADLIETMKKEHHDEITKLTKLLNNQGVNCPEGNFPLPQYLLFKEKYT